MICGAGIERIAASIKLSSHQKKCWEEIIIALFILKGISQHSPSNIIDSGYVQFNKSMLGSF